MEDRKAYEQQIRVEAELWSLVNQFRRQGAPFPLDWFKLAQFASARGYNTLWFWLQNRTPAEIRQLSAYVALADVTSARLVEYARQHNLPLKRSVRRAELIRFFRSQPPEVRLDIATTLAGISWEIIS